MRHYDLVRGDLILALVSDEIYPLEFYGWWTDDRRVCMLVVPHNGLTILAAPHQILCKVTGGKVIHVNPNSFGRTTREVLNGYGEVLSISGRV